MKRSFVIAIMVVLFAACSTKEIDTQTPLPGSEMFYATFEQPAEDDGTRVFVDRKFKVHWNEGDRVSVFNQNEMSDEYRFTGRTGDSGGSFELVYDTPDEWGNPLDHRYSIYPYTQETYWYADDVFSVELPSNQQYREDSFGPGANLMISATDNEEFKFKNACGYLVFKLYGEGAVSAITLEGNNGEHLAGNALITMPFGGVPLVEIESEATSRLSLTCSEPIVLGETANESTWFWFVVPPMTFSKGFTIKVHEASGGVIERSTFKSITIERNKVSMMLPVYVEASSAIPVNTPGAVSMGLSVLWGSFNLGASKPEDYGDFYAWGEIETKDSYSIPTYKWGVETYTYNKFMKYIKYCMAAENGYLGFTDGKTELDSFDDVAHVKLGGRWRMPTVKELEELASTINNPDYKWERTSINGHAGLQVTYRLNNNKLFLPFAGFWSDSNHNGISGGVVHILSSSLDSENPNGAWCLSGSFGGDFMTTGQLYRYQGASIRPVCD